MIARDRSNAGGPERLPAGDRELAERIIAELRASLGAFRCAAAQHLVKSGISMSHVHVLSVLRHHGPMPMSRIAEMLDVSLSNATGLMDRMEERGLIERARVPDDRRLVLVRSTRAGDDALAEMEIVGDELLGSILGRLDAAQLRRLARSLADLREAIRQDPPIRFGPSHGHPVETRPTPNAH